MTRTHYPPEFKLRVAREAAEVGNASEVARRYEVHPTMVSRWLRAYRRDGESAFDPQARRKKAPRSNDASAMGARVHEMERENEQLKKLLGEKDLEIAILRDLLKKGSQRLLKD